MKVFFAGVLVAVGLLAMLVFGLARIFAFNYTTDLPSWEALVAAGLVAGGGTMALVGSALAGGGRPGKWLFAVSFLGFIILMLFGLANVFQKERTYTSIYLLLAGAIGAVLSAGGGIMAGQSSKQRQTR